MGSTSGAELIFWCSIALLTYVYVGYPLLAALRAALSHKQTIPDRRCRTRLDPFVSIVVIAHNEDDRIGNRIENLLALDYPRERRDIVIASDGSTDATVARARAYEDQGVSVRSFALRRGKAAVLNVVVPSLRGDLVLFADARQRFDTATLRALVSRFTESRRRGRER